MWTLIIGASSDLGKSLARSLLSRGEKVAAHYNKNRGALTDLEKGHDSSQLRLIGADLTDPESRRKLIGELAEIQPLITRVVFLASPPLTLKQFPAIPPQAIADDLQTQLISTVEILQAVLPKMTKHRWARVVFVLSSVTLGVPPKGFASYVTAKYALLGLMRSLASEYSHTSVTFNAISPSMIETRFLAQLPEMVVEAAKERHPSKRLATVEEILPAFDFLLSEHSQHLRGANLPLAGGEQF